MDMSSDIDDASLLAALEDEEEDNDDMGLLATQTQQEGLVDHLEGMTPEMFGADDVFDDEVEALPDAHYGLLGGREDLLQPQACLDDLPEEILWQILCEIPARDLYCSISLVCQRWRNIVLDPKVGTRQEIAHNSILICSTDRLIKSLGLCVFPVSPLQEAVLPLCDEGGDDSGGDQPHPV